MAYRKLAERGEFGRVVVCRNCSDIHLSFKDLTVNLKEKEFEMLIELVQEAKLRSQMSGYEPSKKIADLAHLFSAA